MWISVKKCAWVGIKEISVIDIHVTRNCNRDILCALLMFEVLFDGALKGTWTSSILPLRFFSKHLLRYITHTFPKTPNLVVVLDWLSHFEKLHSHESLVWSCPSKSETSSVTANLVASMIVFCIRGNPGFFFQAVQQLSAHDNAGHFAARLWCCLSAAML